MLTQWHYKVMREFATQQDRIMTGKQMIKYRVTKPRPYRLFLYKPSRRTYDYVDYSGNVKKEFVGISDKTSFLEFYGFIKFIGSSKCDKGGFG